MPGNEHAGHRERMRQRFLQAGLDSFAPHEVLELLLFHVIPRRNVNPLAHKLLNHFGSLPAVLDAAPEQLMQVPGIGETTAHFLTLITATIRRADKERLGEKPLITNYREAKEFCRHLFSGTSDEVLYVVCLDAQGRVLHAVRAIIGTIDEITIYPRTIVGAAIRNNAHSVVLAHNHPSGVLEPSAADITTTDQLRRALAEVDVSVLDHIIYADGECVSLEQWQSTHSAALKFPSAASRRAADKQRTTKTSASKAKDAADIELEIDDEA